MKHVCLEVYGPAVGVAWAGLSALEQVDELDLWELQSEAAEEMELEVSGIEGSLIVDGEEQEIVPERLSLELAHPRKGWARYHKITDVCAVDMNAANFRAEFDIDGEYDATKLVLHYKDVFVPGQGVNCSLAVLDHISYAGETLDLEQVSDDNSGFCYCVVSGGKYAYYSEGDDIGALKWNDLPAFAADRKRRASGGKSRKAQG